MTMTVMRNIMTNQGFLRHLCLVIIIFSEVKILVVRISVILLFRFYPLSPIEQHFQANECHQRVFNHRLNNSGQLMFFIQHCNFLGPLTPPDTWGSFRWQLLWRRGRFFLQEDQNVCFFLGFD